MKSNRVKEKERERGREIKRNRLLLFYKPDVTKEA